MSRSHLRARAESTTLLLIAGLVGLGGTVIWHMPSLAPGTTLAREARGRAAAGEAEHADLALSAVDPVAPARHPKAGTAAPGGMRAFGAPVPDRNRTASLTVRVTRSGLPADGTLRFVAGPHAGSDPVPFEAGVLRLTDRLPGLSLVHVESASGAFARREIVLRAGRDGSLDLDFGDHGTVSGTVTTRDGIGIPDAMISLDDQRARTDQDGHFHVARTSIGGILVVRAEGHATAARHLRISDGPDLEPFRLERAASLTVHLAGASGPGAVQLLPIPRGVLRGRRGGGDGYPWSRMDSLVLRGGDSLLLDDLPPSGIRFLAVGRGASGVSNEVWLRAGAENTLKIRMQRTSPVVGEVLRGGQPVAGVIVELVPENRAGARREALGAHAGLGDRHSLGPLNGVRHAVTTGVSGRFRLDPLDLVRERLHVRVTDEAGGVRVVRPLGQIPSGESWRLDLAELQR